VIVAGAGGGGWELGRLLGETTIGYMTVDEAVTQSFEMLLEGSASLWAKLAKRRHSETAQALKGEFTTANPDPDDSGGGRTGRKVSRSQRETGKQRVEELREKVRELKSKANKTRDDVRALEKAKAELRRAINKLRACEEHARIKQHS